MIIAKTLFYLISILTLLVCMAMLLVGAIFVLKYMIEELINEYKATRDKVKSYIAKRHDSTHN